ncbi:esterase/lipase family protein [Rhodococcus gannanensis]|uniref:Esterase/lipase family protein n=1 Tax=Rhodococcus gannanensis TaxID=1960308 RepID=A0ABW4P5W0_9NOCA
MRIGEVVGAALAGAALLAAVTPAGAAPATDAGSVASESVSVSAVPDLPGPVQVTHAAASDFADAHPGSVPPGTNDFGCRPTAEHPDPVVLAHGSDSSAYSDWAAIAPRLHDAGYCVFALDFGGALGATTYGTEDMYVSGDQVADFVGLVLRETGSEKVDLVGFSQGATVTRYFIKLGGAPVVDRWVGLASPSYGGIFYGLVPAANAIPGGRDVVSLFTTVAVAQQAEGSDFLAELNGDGDTVPGVEYTTIGTRYDEMIQPYTNVALRGAGATNILIQDRCPQNMTGHMNMPYDDYTIGLVMQALDPGHPDPVCTDVPLGTGMAGMIGR